MGNDKEAKNISLTADVPCICQSRDGMAEETVISVVREHFIEISVNGRFIARLSCTPDDLDKLVLGRLYTERLINRIEDVNRIFICKKGEIAEVTLESQIELVNSTDTDPTCCTGNRQFLVRKDRRNLEVLKEVQASQDEVFELTEYFQQDTTIHKHTGGTHSCFIRYPDGIIEGYEDISRHNALDKAVGAMLFKRHDSSECMLFTSGRIAADMAEKCIAAGIPILISKASPTESALQLAREHNLNIIGQAWPDAYFDFSVSYTG